jgi:hypothetical protein
MSALSWLRERFGTMPGPLPGQRGIAGMIPEPGPFDHPPAEAIELDENDLPWELRDGEPRG